VSNVLENRLAAICAAARCPECYNDCEVAAAKAAAKDVLMVDESTNAKLVRLCALVREMEGQAVPADDYRIDVVVDPVKLAEAASLANEISRLCRQDVSFHQFSVNCE